MMLVKDKKADKVVDIVEELRDTFFENASRRLTPEEMFVVRKAYDMAETAHSSQVRKSGIPFITHPISVARICNEELGLGANSIVAALLHDVVEDSSFTIDDISTAFGDDVAFLVDVVTKKKKQHYNMSKQLDNFKQMLDSIQYDIRALLIKLADRLHNMRTLESMRTDKQMKIASETDYFYAPLANRLGLYDVKSELENLSLKFRSPQEYARIEKKINSYMMMYDQQIKDFIAPVHKALLQNGINAYIYCKPRSVYAIWRKMQSSGISFKEIEHVHVINLVFPEVRSGKASPKKQCIDVYSVLTDIYKERPSSLINYIDSPKENGYESLHCQVMCNSGRWVEVHISTDMMHNNARLGCVVERTSGGDQWVSKFKEVLKELASTGRECAFIEDVVSTFYNDDIVVFTPKGGSVLLPKNATALDMAYEIHTDLGNRAKYCRINGKLSSIFTVLKRGDRVDIGTGDDVWPTAMWLDKVCSYKARKCVRMALRRSGNDMETSPYEMCSYCNPLPGDEIIGFKQPSDMVVVHKRNCRKAISMSAQEGDNIIAVNIPVFNNIRYNASIDITSVDRDGLLCDLVEIISRKQNLSIESLHTVTVENIVSTQVKIQVPSAMELNATIQDIEKIKGVEEVKRVSLKN